MTFRIRAWQNNSLLYQTRALEAHSTENRAAYANYLAESSSPTAKAMDSTDRLKALRAQFDKHGIDIYVALTQDEHESEYTSETDNRRGYISGEYFFVLLIQF